MSTVLLTVEEAEKAGFASLLLHTRNALLEVGKPEHMSLVDNASMLRYITQKYGKANTGALVSELKENNLIKQNDSTADRPAANSAGTPGGQVKGIPTKPATVGAPATTSAGHQSPPPQAQDDTAAIDNARKALESLNTRLSKDGVWIRTDNGMYVCPFCVDEGLVGKVFISPEARGIGGHIRSHKTRNRSIHDELIAELPNYGELEDDDTGTEETVPEPAAWQEGSAATGMDNMQHRTLESSEDVPTPAEDTSGRPNPDSTANDAAAAKDPAAVTDPAQLDKMLRNKDIEGLQAAMEQLIEQRLSQSEVKIVRAVITIMSLPPENVKYLFDKYVKQHAGQLAKILEQ